MLAQVEKIKERILPLGITILLPLSIGILHLNNLINIWLYPKSSDYNISNGILWLLLFANILLFLFILGFAKYNKQNLLFHRLCRYLMVSSWVSVFVKYFSDSEWMYLYAKHQGMSGDALSRIFEAYFGHEKWIYIFLMIVALGAQIIFEKNNIKCSGNKKKKFPLGLLSLSLLFPIALMILPFIENLYLFGALNDNSFIDLSTGYKWQVNIVGSIIAVLLVTITIREKNKGTLSISHLVHFIQANAILLAVSISFQMLANILPFFVLSGFESIDKFTMAFAHVKTDGAVLFPTLATLLILAFTRKYYKRQPFTESNAKDTTGNFGTAAWMSEKELFEKGCYDANTGPIIGTDAKEKPLYAPLLNTLILGPPSSGKSLKYISALLTEDRPAFILDVKGELCATTGRCRIDKMGRQAIVVDAYRIMQTPDFIKSKPASMKFEYHINPFDYLPEEEGERDRMLTAFASSFIISDSDSSGSSRHFEDNAKILIRGYMDYMMKTIKQKQKRTLPKLYQLMCESKEEADNTFQMMKEMGGYAAAAANQILRVGSHERGSILSTTYRQIDWIGDSNIQRILSESNFNLRGFLKGNMDIYVILPNEQIQDKSRLVRMLLSLIKAISTQAAPSELPAKKMLFLLDELAQFGYCQDVEQFIEVMRSYKAVLWPAFQSMDQITKIYKKADLFLDMPLKQIFTISNLDTMKWIQSVIGKTTATTKSLSTTEGDSRQKMQIYGGSISNSETENIHETGIDLIKLNEIRELPADEQLILWTGNKPIKCKKVFYYKHSMFKGRFDDNPFEKQ